MAPDPSPSAGPGSGAIPPPPQWWSETPGPEGSERPESVLSAHQQTWKRESLQQELAACRQELASMRALLDDLPQIFESKFENRLQPLLEQKQRLLEGNQGLREQLSRLQPGGKPIAGSLMPAPVPAPPASRRDRWTSSLRHAFGLTGRRADCPPER
ncbi:MAG: hypothetical protein AB1Z21_08380 [Synechococcaceae cyanobacterium]